jgi:hypothetical protein
MTIPFASDGGTVVKIKLYQRGGVKNILGASQH